MGLQPNNHKAESSVNNEVYWDGKSLLAGARACILLYKSSCPAQFTLSSQLTEVLYLRISLLQPGVCVGLSKKLEKIDEDIHKRVNKIKLKLREQRS